jgi:hypothetical protein
VIISIRTVGLADRDANKKAPASLVYPPRPDIASLDARPTMSRIRCVATPEVKATL